MPVHRVSSARLHEQVEAIERSGEIPVGLVVDPDDTSTLILLTRRRSDGLEYRAELAKFRRPA